MTEEEKPQEEETDHEEEVLNRWQRIKQWFEIAMATKKVAMLIWSLIIGTAGTAIYGEVTDTKPLHDAAVAVGLVEEKVPVATGDYVSAEEFRSFIEWQKNHTHEHTHDFTIAEHSHELPSHEHPDQPHKHADHIHASHSHPEIMAEIANKEVSGGGSIDLGSAMKEAIERHIREDH